MSVKSRILVNEIIENEFAMSRRSYQYFFFQITKEEYAGLSCVKIELEVQSGQAQLDINGYREKHAAYRVGGGYQMIRVPAEQIDKGENILAYKGQVDILSVTPECMRVKAEDKAYGKVHIAPN